MTGEKQQLLCPFLSLSKRQRKSVEEKGRETERSCERKSKKRAEERNESLTREMIYGSGTGCVSDVMT